MKTKLFSLLMCAAASCSAAVVVQILPAGPLPGNPGETVGWGVNISSDTHFLVPTSVTFSPFPGAGIFTDLLTDILVVVGPGPLENPNYSEAFDLLLSTGLASFSIDPIYLNALIEGDIAITYDLYTRSPNDPLFDPISDAFDLGVSYQQAVSIQLPPPPGTVPEPTSVSLLLGVAAGWAVLSMRKRPRLLSS